MTNRLPFRLVPALLAGVLGATACTAATTDNAGSSGSTSTTNLTNLSSDEIILTSGLATVDSCDALLERLKDEAFERVGPYGFDQGGGYFFDDVIALEAEESASDSAGESATAAPLSSFDGDDAGRAQADTAGGEDGSYSGTNNQEQDVDEADLVKTDGDRLIVVNGNTLRVIDTTRSTPTLTKTIELPQDSWGGQLFLEGDRALLMTSGWTERPFVERSIPTDWYPGSPIGRLIEIDLEAGRVSRTLEFEGGYLSAREVDGSIRIVLTASANRFAFVYPSNEGATESAEKANRDLIERSTIDQWLPTYRITEGGETVADGPIVDCDRVHLPADFAGFGSLVMLTADIENGLQINDALSVFTDAQTVYASTDRVVVATPRWPLYGPDGELDDAEDNGADYSTAIHTFDITDPDRADYVASGSVRGHLLNQFSLSEYGGYLRVATTDGSPWWGGNETSESFVTIMEEDGRALQPVGQVGGLGRGEQIFAVRFLGDVGYVVTFEQIDPLYTIDLSEPTDPEVVGELKIPGFSSYLHPLDEDHLLGVGTDGTDEGFTSGAVVSLFDVSDLANPIRTAKLVFDHGAERGQGDSYSPVSDDAKAFTYWNGTAVIPVSWWQYNPQDNTDQNGSDAVLVDVDVDGNLTEIGRVSHPSTTECESGIYYEDGPQPVPAETVPDAEVDDTDSDDAEASFVEGSTPAEEPPPAVEIAPREDEFCYSYAPQINRSIIIDDNLYTISEGGVRVNEFDGLRDVTWIPFQQR